MIPNNKKTHAHMVPAVVSDWLTKLIDEKSPAWQRDNYYSLIDNLAKVCREAADKYNRTKSFKGK